MTDNKQNAGGEAFKVTGDWAIQSKQLKEFSQLTDSDVNFEEGKEHEMISRIGTRLNKKHDEVISIIRKGETTIA
jgi:hypothetical protein